MFLIPQGITPFNLKLTEKGEIDLDYPKIV